MDIPTIREMFDQNPDRMIDEAIPFTFKEVPGRVKLFDAVAAGCAYYVFEFIDGPFRGRKIFCTDVYRTPMFHYAVHDRSDGM